jgi:hypothetical protein
MEDYREELRRSTLAEVEQAAARAKELCERTDPAAPFYAELVELARIAGEVAVEKRTAHSTQ